MVTKEKTVADIFFPPIYRHTSVAFLTHCPGFVEAKNGSMRAALSVANACVKKSIVSEIIEKYPDAVLLPVITKNKLPVALAECIGLKINTEVKEAQCINRKKMNGMQRLLIKPEFIGKIEQGIKYIIADDIITQGGTVSALKKYITARGGFVCAVVALAGNGNLAPNQSNILKLNEKFDTVRIKNILSSFNACNDLSELTNPEMKYLLRFKETGRIVDKAAAVYSA